MMSKDNISLPSVRNHSVMAATELQEAINSAMYLDGENSTVLVGALLHAQRELMTAISLINQMRQKEGQP